MCFASAPLTLGTQSPLQNACWIEWNDDFAFSRKHNVSNPFLKKIGWCGIMLEIFWNGGKVSPLARGKAGSRHVFFFLAFFSVRWYTVVLLPGRFTLSDQSCQMFPADRPLWRVCHTETGVYFCVLRARKEGASEYRLLRGLNSILDWPW